MAIGVVVVMVVWWWCGQYSGGSVIVAVWRCDSGSVIVVVWRCDFFVGHVGAMLGSPTAYWSHFGARLGKIPQQLQHSTLNTI